MGYLAKILGYVYRSGRGEARADIGGGNIRTCQHYQQPGMSSRPLPGDTVVAVAVPGTGRTVIVGSIPREGVEVGEGEVTVYAVTSAGVACEIALKSGGRIQVRSDQEVDINGVKINSDGSVEIPVSLKVAGKEIAGHIHAQGPDSSGDVQQSTGPNL